MKLVEDTKQVKDAISFCGIDRESLKTENFYTSEKTKRVEDQYGNSSYRHIGYDVTHYMSFIFDNNNELLGKVLYELSKLKINPRINVSYVVKNPEIYKVDLIGEAVNDARRKAKAMTQASGVKLGEIIRMDYSYETITFESRQYLDIECSNMRCSTAGAFDIDMTPKDVNMSDTVTIEWMID